jgi:hypothetical protein
MSDQRSAELFVTDWQLPEQESDAFVAHGTRAEFLDDHRRADVIGLGRDEQIRQHLVEVLRRYAPTRQ